MQKLRVIYFGTPDFSARVLENLLTNTSLPVEIVAVVTQPDKPVGKKKIMTKSPVKEMARKYNVPVISDQLESVFSSNRFQPNTDSNQAKLGSNRIDLALLFAYGKIIPADLLTRPRFGFWNIHPSLLPQFRGPSPIAYPLILGEKITGVTLMKMDEKVDHGPIIDQAEYVIKPTETRTDLEKNLSDLGYKLFCNKISHFVLDEKYHEQDHTLATFTKLLKREDGFVPMRVLLKTINGTALDYEELPLILKNYIEKLGVKDHSYHLKFAILNLFRGLSPWPGVYTIVKINGTEKRLKINELHLENEKIILDRVQLEGKNEVDFVTFNRAYNILKK